MNPRQPKKLKLKTIYPTRATKLKQTGVNDPKTVRTVSVLY